MFEKIQRDIAARVSVQWISKNDRVILEKKFSLWIIIKTIVTDERVWPVLAYRYKNLPVLGFFLKLLSILIRIFMGVKLDGEIGPGFSIGHASCIFLNRNFKAGRDLRINQGTTIAGGEKGYPQLGDNVHVAAGAKILGNLTIGDNVHVGMNAVVLHNVPSNATVVGIPARVVKLNGKRMDVQLKK